MRQLIYRNPLSVLWMMQEHGVKFKQKLCVSQDRDVHEHTLIAEYINDGYKKNNNREFYVHPDSLPLFEPQEGDQISWDGDSKYRNVGYYRADMRKTFHERNGAIDKRNGIPFHWPCEIREESDVGI